MSIQEELASFYDSEAVKYAQTREKHRSEEAIFLDEIQNTPAKTIRILEFGCGSGRLLKALTHLTHKKFHYVGIDLSAQLLKIAKKQVKPTHKHLSCTFVCGDILEEIVKYKQESYDYVIGIASFQHIPQRNQRMYLMKNIYRILHYEGKLMMSNWSFSQRFLHKYQQAISRALGRYILSWGKKSWNDILVPWKNHGKTAHRFYHIFTIKELKNLVLLS